MDVFVLVFFNTLRDPAESYTIDEKYLSLIYIADILRILVNSSSFPLQTNDYIYKMLQKHFKDLKNQKSTNIILIWIVKAGGRYS